MSERAGVDAGGAGRISIQGRLPLRLQQGHPQLQRPRPGAGHGGTEGKENIGSNELALPLS